MRGLPLFPEEKQDAGPSTAVAAATYAHDDSTIEGAEG